MFHPFSIDRSCATGSARAWKGGWTRFRTGETYGTLLDFLSISDPSRSATAIRPAERDFLRIRQGEA